MSQQGLLTDSTTALADIETLTGDAGGAIGPDGAGNVNLLGTSAQGISTSGAGNTITFTISDATDSQKGVSELATDAEAIAGVDTGRTIVPSSLSAKLGTQTQFALPIGAGSSAALSWTAAPTNGQILIGSTGVTPSLATLTAGTGVDITNGAASITVSVSNRQAGTGQTVGAVTSDLITIPLGGSANVYTIQASIAGFESTGPSGCGYRLTGIFKTTGAAATIIGTVDKIVNEDAALAAADAVLVASGNNVIVRVTGAAGLTINYAATSDLVSVN